MSNFGKVLRGLVVLVVAVGLGTLFGWLVSRQGEVAPVAVPSATNQPVAVVPTPAPAPTVAPLPVQPEVKPLPITNAQADTAATVEQRLDDILLSEDSNNNKADRIRELIPLAPPDQQPELAQHMLNMTQDDHYDGVAEMLTNASTPPDVLDVLKNDMLNRPDSIKLPLLLDIARDSDHPWHSEALDMLGLLMQQDNGSNWDQWSTAINGYLQNNSQ